MTGYLDWFTGHLKHNYSSKGLHAFLGKTLIFLIVEFGLLYSMYVGRLDRPISSALLPILQQLILLGLFLLFAWRTIGKLPRFPFDVKKMTPVLTVAVLLILYRLTLPVGAPMNRLITGGALVCLFFAVFGVGMLRHLMHNYQRQIVYTSIGFLYFLYVITIEGESLTRALSMILWA